MWAPATITTEHHYRPPCGFAAQLEALGRNRDSVMGRSSRFLRSVLMLVIVLTSCQGGRAKPSVSPVDHRITALVGGTVLRRAVGHA